ncbi:uncharacterized protein TNCV_3719441 [Trichonephila clavipes]|nr:uncharacterized protein TNCV_3719441 [Trichonephila clavipes]
MTYLAKARKDDLKILTAELGLEIGEMMRVIDFKKLILTSKDYEEQFTKTLLETIIETRVPAERYEKEKNDYKRKQGLILELEPMKLSMTATSTNISAAYECEQVDIGEVDYRKHLDDFLPVRIIGRLECGRTHLEVSEELGIAQSVISRLWQRFQDDGNVSRCYSTGCLRVTTPNENRYIFGSYYQRKQTEHSIRPVSSALFSYWYDSFQGRPFTDA